MITMFRRSLAGMALILVVAVIGCSKPFQRCEPTTGFMLPSHYDDVHPTLTTPSGIAVDASGQPVDLALLDRLTDEVEDCLVAAFPGGVLPSPTPASCAHRTFPERIRRECITVKVAPDWFVGRSGDQLLPYGNGGGCTDKGYEGPCYYRATLQDDLTAVVTPDLYLYAAPLVMIATGCAMPWNDARFAACIRTAPR